MKKLITAVAVLALALFACQQVDAQARTVNLGKSLVRVANPGALSMPGMPGMPGMAGGSTFPNNYSSTVSSFSYDGNGGMTLSYQFTGTTQPSPMCNGGAQHFPKVTVNVLKNGTVMSSHSVTGTRVAPCSQMNQTVSVSFNFFSDSCDLAFFVDGTCTLAEQEDNVVCTVAGDFAFFAKHFQFEDAETSTIAIPGTGPRFQQQPYCQSAYCPPDYTGPFDPQTDDSKVYDNEAILLRWAPILQGFTGSTWHYFVGLGNSVDGYYQGSNSDAAKYPCTNKDKCDSANPPPACGTI